jgi:hypothetical protein
MGYSLSGNTADTYFQFMKHATKGALIAQKMQKYSYGEGSTNYSDPRYNQYDMHFGFWVSYWADRSGIEMNFLSDLVFDENGQLNEEKSTFSLIDLANITKAISYQEKLLYASDHKIQKGADGRDYAGLMMVPYNTPAFFETSDYYCPWGKGFNYSPSIKHWRQAVNTYGGYVAYGKIILDELVYKGIARKRKGDKIHGQPLLP